MTRFRQAPHLAWALVAAVPIGAPQTAGAAAQLPSTTDTIKIDGILDEAAWKSATRIRIDTETYPAENIPARVDTVAYLIEDGQKLYIAFDARDPNPGAIRAFLQDRDSAWNDDFVGVVLDTYNDERRAFEFFANPFGIQMDLTNDDVNQREDSSWDAIWDSAGQITAKGYIVEMEIPLSQLRFPNVDGVQTWGIDLLRFHPRDQRRRYSNNPLERSVNCYLCQLSKIQGLAGAEPGRDLEIVPTLTGTRTESTDDPGTLPLRDGSTDTEAGISVRWGITPDMTANLAINPDFSQVEADVAQLDVNNQFALFFPEKRPFFLEGADYFNTPIDAVFTRTVADPDVGAKLTGKRGDHTYGVFAAQDAITNLLFPGAFGSDGDSLDEDNTAFVGRYSYGIGDALSIGALITTRESDSYHNYVGGLDASWRVGERHRIQVQYLQSDTEYPDAIATEFGQPEGSFTGSGTLVEYEYDSRNWDFEVSHEDLSADFRADAGFVPQVDASKQVIGFRRLWFSDEGTWWTRARLRADWDITHNDAGDMLEREVEAYFSVNGPLQSFFELGGLSRDTLWDGVTYREDKVSFYAEFKPRSGIATGVWARTGDQVDFANSRLGDELRIEPWLEWNVNRHLLLTLESAFVRLDTKAGDKVFDASVNDVRLTYQFSRRSFLRLTTQFRDVERNPDVYVDEVNAQSKRVGRQLLYSYKLNPQTVFFLGYSDNHVNDDDLRGLEETDRTWFLKVGYAWTP